MHVFMDENSNLYIGLYSSASKTWVIWNKEERYLGFLGNADMSANLITLGAL
jgi:hypothetical protein